VNRLPISWWSAADHQRTAAVSKGGRRRAVHADR